jgi:hypothetical protein
MRCVSTMAARDASVTLGALEALERLGASCFGRPLPGPPMVHLTVCGKSRRMEKVCSFSHFYMIYTLFCSKIFSLSLYAIKVSPQVCKGK